MPEGNEPAEPAKLPDPPPVEQRKSHRVLGFLATFLVVLVATGVGSSLVEVPPSLPSDAPSVLLWLAGALLLAVAAVVATFFDKVWARLTTTSVTLPKRLWRGLRGKRAALFVALLLVAAGTAALVPGPGDGLEPGTIRLLSGFDLSPSDTRRVLIDQWNEGHPDNKVEVIPASGATDQQYQRMKNDADSTREADIYLIDQIWMSEFIARGYIRPIDEALRQSEDKDFFDNVLSTCRDTYGGKDGLWGLPLNADVGLMFHRTGPTGVTAPKSWDGYFGSAAKQAVAASATDGRLAFANAAQFRDTEILTVTAFEAIWAADGKVVNEDGKPVYNPDRSEVEFDEQAREGLRKLASAYRDPAITAQNGKEEGGEEDNEEREEDDELSALTRFKRGEALYMRNWAVSNDQLKESSELLPVSFEIAPLPHPSVLGGQNLAISAATHRPRAAQAFMEFLTSASSQLILFDIGGFAASRPGAYYTASAVTRPYKDVLRTAVLGARLRPVSPNYVQFSEEFQRGIQRALNNNGRLEPDFPRVLADKLR